MLENLYSVTGKVHPSPADPQVSSIAHDYLAPEVVDRLCIVGNAEQCTERLRELHDIGVTHVNFYAQTAEFEEQMTIYSQEILPQLRATA